MTTSKAGINSQSGDRIDSLTQALADLQEQVDDLGGGALVTTFFSGCIVVAGGQPAQPVFVITPPEGQRVVLNQLAAGTGANEIVGISVSGSLQGAIINEKTLSGSPFDVGKFAVGYIQGTTTTGGAGAIDKLVFEPDEVATVSRSSGVLPSALRYSYSYAKDA